jgi:hypothetical protein
LLQPNLAKNRRKFRAGAEVKSDAHGGMHGT